MTEDPNGWDSPAAKSLKKEIAVLVAERNVAIDHMTEVGVEACRERDARIAELEAENEKNYRKWQDEILRRAVAEGRAEQAEAELAVLKEVGATFVLDCISDEAENLTYHGTDYVKWADVKTVVSSCLRNRWTARDETP